MVIARTTGKEFGPQSIKRRTLLQNLRAWYDRELVKADAEVTHQQTGLKIKFDGAGRKKMASLPDTMIRAVPAIPEILRKGRYAGPKPETKGRPGIEAWHYFVGRVEVAGNPVAVRLSVRKMANGHFLYSLDRPVDRGGGWTRARVTREGNTTAQERSAAPVEGNVPPLDGHDNSFLRRAARELPHDATLRRDPKPRPTAGDRCIPVERTAGLYRVGRRPGQGQQPLAQGAVSPSERRRRKRQSGRLTGRTPSFSVAATEGLLRN